MLQLIMKSLKKADNMQIFDVMVDRVGFKDVKKLKCIMIFVFCVFSSLL